MAKLMAGGTDAIESLSRRPKQFVGTCIFVYPLSVDGEIPVPNYPLVGPYTFRGCSHGLAISGKQYKYIIYYAIIVFVVLREINKVLGCRAGIGGKIQVTCVNISAFFVMCPIISQGVRKSDWSYDVKLIA